MGELRWYFERAEWQKWHWAKITLCSKEGRNEHYSKEHKWKYMAGPGIELEIPASLAGNRTRDPYHTSQVLYHWGILADIHGPTSPNYHIPPPLQSPRPLGLTTNTSLPCQDLLNTNACLRKAKAPNVVEKGGINIYKEVQMKIYYRISRRQM